MPLGYEVFAGNTADVTTVKGIVEMMEKRYGKSNLIWVMGRGMTSEDNLEFLRQENRRYIIGTNKALLKKFEPRPADCLTRDRKTARSKHKSSAPVRSQSTAEGYQVRVDRMAANRACYGLA